MVSTAAFHARVRGSVPGLGRLKETKMFLPHPRVKLSIVGSLRDREVVCSASEVGSISIWHPKFLKATVDVMPPHMNNLIRLFCQLKLLYGRGHEISPV